MLSYKKAERQYLKATKNRPANLDQDWTPFRAAEKRFKARFPPLDLSSVLDLACRDDHRRPEIEHGRWAGSPDSVECTRISSGVYTVPQVPGLVILPSFISQQQQRALIKWSLAEHARPPNDSNLDIHYHVPDQGLWNAWLDARHNPEGDFLVQPRAPDPDAVESAPGPRQLVNNEPASPESIESLSMLPKPPIPPSPTAQPTPVSALVPKLRWSNIGWYYHWGTKQYDFSKGKIEVDDRVRVICKSAVRAVDWKQVHGGIDGDWGPGGADWDSWEQTYEPDAGIVNFYQEKDTLMAHVDRSEVCATSPLVSISLGNAAVFLIGGTTRDTEPTAILLRSGDVVIMSGPQCRRAYHGVPRILSGTLPTHLRGTEKDWEAYSEYMDKARININVRQVFPIGFNVVAK